ncbi:MAG: kinase [Candidatus Yanofskybacteria bacterium RIFCSPLOWO2_02_FULL_43_10]|uniref:Kinase n=1 Tax=Candidatus Yanofskybacteria bacterium RIFCSPLOWO2_12_FULL_43_11b TaxID=1802710 RepID=A0A1F8H8Q0_9BACT|nr:MAG: kinase [Candidatus Yanofskybacteria bacterium RIFCSPHIGHO2_01_FULL_43_32]OGN10984.1 MAG: kinase [Candidatus Yanofskybacteria bacterium RIFCSPHIGHO2_02_FULL_43_12]OGN24112.1 MAG: kinase [Candidatus Yanofskybacteria bacterium RIFCSPLOWO2_01_FULL_43_46]OGN30572.1 MAG: kinase [Candidatus Yanofskybacteria bacterium RIFCSPLOWO2_02_FULL_43_10]OGN33560.1 MAG: kinase [Candidatus Yanofskybacteria bacterium RIFCSPLOWO2_12_FULL_43_11b]
MIITRTPFRISFFGGGTDYPVWYEKNGGSVLSMAIDKYSYINLRSMPPFFKHKYKIIYSKHEEVKHINKIKHPSARETLRYLNIDGGVVIHHDGDLPAMSGLGSSSSFTVGLVHALSGLKGEIKTKRQLALDAIHIEQNLIKENVGSQDQTIAAFGGLNRIDFGGPQKIQVYPITISKERTELFKSHLMLFFTDFTRQASKIAKHWIKNTKNNGNELKSITNMVDEGVAILCSNRNIIDFGKLLHEHWLIKRGLAQKISNPKIDEIYKIGREAGAIGGKLLGAGGGGFMLFFAKPEDHPKIKEKLKKFLYVPFNIDMLGSQIIYHNLNNSF